MSEWRVRLLKFMEQRPVLISVVQSTVMAGVSIPALLIERQNGCVQIIRLWLIGALVRVWMRMFDSFWLASLTGQPVTSSSVRCAYMWQECLDVFGVMWQILMSIVVFNNGQCVYKSPLIFVSCLVYLFGTYVYVGTYLLTLRSLTLRPPTSTEDIQYLANLRQAAIDLRNQLSNAPPQNSTAAQASTQIDPNAWGAWLESYGSFAVPYEKSELNALAYRSRASTGVTERDASGGSYGSAGDIELGRLSSDTSSLVDGDTAREPSVYATLYTQQNPLDARVVPLSESNAECKDVAADLDEPHIVIDSNANDTVEVCAICLLSFAPPDDITTATHSEKEKDSSVVRYPCAGNHFFHAHCLHKWLQADAVRKALQPRRIVGPVTNTDVRTLVTCPICREHPSMQKDNEVKQDKV